MRRKSFVKLQSMVLCRRNLLPIDDKGDGGLSETRIDLLEAEAFKERDFYLESSGYGGFEKGRITINLTISFHL